MKVSSSTDSELEFQPGSRGRVLRNLLDITRVRDIEEAETQALNVTQRAALKIYGPEHRFTPADIRRLVGLPDDFRNTTGGG